MEMQSKRVVAAVVGIVVAIAAGWYFRAKDGAVNGNVNLGEVPSVNAPGNDPAPASYVGTYVNTTSASIQLDSVAVAGTTVTLLGSAGGWYFEASFPVEIYDNANVLIGSGIATAQADWMTASLVPFVATVTLNAPYSGPATVVLRKDNPSGEPANDASASYGVTL